MLNAAATHLIAADFKAEAINIYTYPIVGRYKGYLFPGVLYEESLVRFLKSAKSDIKAKAIVAPSKLGRQGMLSIKRLLDSFPLGARIRHSAEFDEGNIIEGLVLGYGFDDHYVYLQRQVEFIDSDTAPEIQITAPSLPAGQTSMKRVTNFQLLIPSDTGEERKLNYDSRASLGRNGPFAKGSYLSITSLGNGAENLRISCDVQKRMVLKDGPHRGLQVAVLNVQLGTIEDYEPRAQSRIETRTAATVCRDGTDKVLPAFVLDVSEFFLRLELDPEDREWPPLNEKSFVLITLKPWPNRPLLKLKCHFVREAGSERVFEIDKLLKQGKYTKFQQLDGIELKIALMS